MSKNQRPRGVPGKIGNAIPTADNLLGQANRYVTGPELEELDGSLKLKRARRSRAKMVLVLCPSFGLP